MKINGLLGAWVAVVSAATGCSFSIDPDRFAAPDVPDVGAIEIVPGAADTTMGLEATYDAVADVAYAVQWSCERNGSVTACPSAPAGAILDPSMTTKRQRWTVTVTPSLGILTGTSATQSIEIGNAPPSAPRVGLSSYRPFVGDEIAAFPGVLSDPDLEDALQVRYEWLLDGETDPIGTTERLYLDPEDDSLAGRELTLRFSSTDGTDIGESATIGPLVIRPDVTRWQHLQPQHYFIESFVDEKNQRLMFIDSLEGTIWEYNFFGTRGGFTKLAPTGPELPEPFTLSRTTAYDSTRDRVIVIDAAYDLLTGRFKNSVHAISTGVRGQEHVEEIQIAEGVQPSPRYYRNTAFYDETCDCVYLYGGVPLAGDPGSPPPLGEDLSDLWSFDLGTNTFEKHTVLGAEPISLSRALRHPNGRDVMFFGGATFDPFAGGLTPFDAVYTLSLIPDPVTGDFSMTAPRNSNGEIARLPNALFGVTGVVNPTTGTAIVGFGLDDLGGADDLESKGDAWSFDFDTNEFTQIDVPQMAKFAAFLGTGLHLPADSFNPARVIMSSSFVYNTVAFSADEAPTWMGIVDATHATVPPAISWGTSSEVYGIHGGNTDLNSSQDEAWLFQDGVWAGSSVDVAYAGREGAHANIRDRFVGGRTNDFETMDVWNLRTGQSAELTVNSPVPPSRELHAQSDGCSTLTVFGGRFQSTTLGDTWRLSCGSEDSNCTWTEVVGGTPPSPRTGAAFARAGSKAVLFGGQLPGSAPIAYNDLHELPCFGGGTWTSVTPTGDPPSGRMGHSMMPTTFKTPMFGSSWLVVGGLGGTQDDDPAENEAWLLTRTQTGDYAWELLDAEDAPDYSRAGHALIEDRGKYYMYGGQIRRSNFGNPSMSDMWQLILRE